MTAAEGFEFRERKSGEVAIFNNGKLVKMMRGAEAKKFLQDVKKGDAQQVMLDTVGDKGARRPGNGPIEGGKALGGDGKAHAHGVFRRRSS
jgi:hypothetical protein